MENSAVLGYDQLYAIYREITSRPYGYLWLKKTATEDDDLLHDGFGQPGIKITALKNGDIKPRQQHDGVLDKRGVGSDVTKSGGGK